MSDSLSQKNDQTGYQYYQQEILLGTQTSIDGEKAKVNKLLIQKVSLPDEGTVLEANYYESQRDELGSTAFDFKDGEKQSFPTIEDFIEIIHDGDVDRARIM